MECVSQVVVWEQLVQVVVGAKEVELGIQESLLEQEAQGWPGDGGKLGSSEAPKLDEVGM